MIAALRWLNDISEGVLAVASGLGTTARFLGENWGNRGGGTSITRQYPQDKAILADNFRGHLFNKVEDCITCSLCAKACPVDCFVIVGEKTEDNKLRPSVFDIDLSKCIYCGLCTRVCPTDCLDFTQDFEVDPVQGYLLRMSAEQTKRKLDSTEVERFNVAIAKSDAVRSAEEQQFMAGIEDPNGSFLIAKFGVGTYTAEQAATVNAERERRAIEKKAADAAKKAAEAAKKTGGGASPGNVPPPGGKTP